VVELGMNLTIPTWLAFLFLAVAAFAPLVSFSRRWWIPYYGALMVCWVLVSVAAMRRLARQERKAKRKIARMMRQLRDVGNAEVVETAVDAAPRRLARKRLIIVARDEAGLYDSIRSDRVGDETVLVITDRRSSDRRRLLEAHSPDRRRAERRCRDIQPLLLTQGWAQVSLPER
jgi:hypothetical protein